MARPRKPTNILHLAGAFKKDPQRLAARQAEPKPAAPLGACPDWMDDTERACWQWIVDRVPAGVLGNCDDGIVELTAWLRAQFVARKADRADRALLRQCYTELGCTPSSRSRVQAKPTEDEKPKNDFAAV